MARGVFMVVVTCIWCIPDQNASWFERIEGIDSFDLVDPIDSIDIVPRRRYKKPKRMITPYLVEERHT